MKLVGNKETRVRDLAVYLLIRTQIVLGFFFVLFTTLNLVFLFCVCIISMGIIASSPKDGFSFFQIIARAIIDWKYKNGNYRDSELAGKLFRKPEDWLALALILDYFMIEILGQSK